MGSGSKTLVHFAMSFFKSVKVAVPLTFYYLKHNKFCSNTIEYIRVNPDKLILYDEQFI